ncbi:MAG TPA: hypothetical protein IAB83_09840 [Candidatus Faecousia faecavium]|nr:hypothetical protein [Candidatus Faecousia faecavium]
MSNKELNYSCAECDSLQPDGENGTQYYCSIMQQYIETSANGCHHFNSESLGIAETDR